MRTLPVLVALALVVACATTGRSYGYRPSGWDGPAWTIHADSQSRAFKDTISITINGEAVASGTLHARKKNDALTGTYLEHEVLGVCQLVQESGVSYGHECTVFVNMERAALLRF